ncbi:galactokinase [Candidatus Latescibacterota bacterium]
MNSLITKVVDTFNTKWQEKPRIVAAAPGRVNLIGEHTDYTGGFVLPAAIDREIVFAAHECADSVIRGYSIDFDEEASCEIGSYDPGHPSGWFRYVMGVLSELEKTGRTLRGFRFVFGGNVPIGSGLSSSAALELAVLTACEGLMNFRMKDVEAALLCQRAENNFVGMNCGIMDQYISKTGKANHAILIDCTDLSSRAVTLNIPSHTWLVIDSNKRRGLVDSEYNRRRSECEEGLKCAQTVFKGKDIKGLRDITVDDLDMLKASCDDTIFRRVKHIVTENDRVLQTEQALESGDRKAVGTYLYASHESLRDDFEVSCSELDMLVDILSTVDGVSGARLTGAGFGGCVIALVANDSIGAVEAAIEEKYHPESLPKGTKADIWPVKISDGARIVDVQN